MSFIIEINGKDITTIEEIRENFDIDVLLSHRDNFDVWLAGWDYEDEATQVRELPPDLSDDEWLKKVCKIIGIPSATLTAAKRKRTSEAKKAEKAAAEAKKKNTVVKKKAVEKDSDKFNFDNLQITIKPQTTQPTPDCVSEKGILTCRFDSKVVFSTDGVIFTEEESPLSYDITCARYVNGFFVILTYRDGLLYSSDGKNWHQVERQKFRHYGLCDKIKDVVLSQIAFDGEQYIIICYQAYKYDEGGWFSDAKWRDDYHIAKAKSLEGPWETEPVSGINGLTLLDFAYCNGKYILFPFLEPIYYSCDAVSWTIANGNDREWLDGLYINQKKIEWFDSGERFSISRSCILHKNGIAFKAEENKILAAPIKDVEKKLYGEFKIVAKCHFLIKDLYLQKDKFLIYGENDRYALGEFRDGIKDSSCDIDEAIMFVEYVFPHKISGRIRIGMIKEKEILKIVKPEGNFIRARVAYVSSGIFNKSMEVDGHFVNVAIQGDTADIYLKDVDDDSVDIGDNLIEVGDFVFIDK